MTQSVAVVRNTLNATAASTTDFTSSGFGTPTAAIIFMGAANSTTNPESDSVISIGFYDGAAQSCMSVSEDDNVSTTNTYRYASSSLVAAQASSATPDITYSASFITDGLRLTVSTTNSSSQRFCTVLLFSGVSSKVTSFSVSNAENSETVSASLGFAPALVFATSIGGSLTTGGVAGILSFGVADSNANRMLSYGAVHGQSTSKNSLLFSETRCCGQTYNDTVTWTGEITTLGSDTFTLTTRDGGSSGDGVAFLALGGTSHSIGTLTTPASTGNDDVATTGIDPDAVLIALTCATGTTLETGSNANGFCIGVADSTNEYSHTYTSEDNAGTTNCESEASASNVVNLNSSSGGSVSSLAAASHSNGTEKFTLNYSAVPGTATKGFYVAFGAATAGATTAVGSASGASTATGTGASTFGAAGSSAGSGTATAVGASTATSAGSASGIATATAVGSAAGTSAGSSAGTSTASAVGSSTSAAAGSSAGLSTATAVSTGTITASGSAAGTATALAGGSGTAAAAGSAAGTSTATATYGNVASGAGSSSGSATASGVGALVAAAVASANGIATALAVSEATITSVGSAAGTSSALGYSETTVTELIRIGSAYISAPRAIGTIELL